jgi:transposase
VADEDHVVFRYTPRRKSDGPREFLRGYTGYVQADAANLYDRLYADGDDEGAMEVGCWAHARRRYFEAQVTDRERALIGLGFIKRLYEADRVASRAPPSRRTEERRRLAAPVLEGFKAWLDTESLVVLPKAPIADALGYTRNQWSALTRFLDDARLKLDNNAAERQLRRVAVGRHSRPDGQGGVRRTLTLEEAGACVRDRRLGQHDDARVTAPTRPRGSPHRYGARAETRLGTPGRSRP